MARIRCSIPGCDVRQESNLMYGLLLRHPKDSPSAKRQDRCSVVRFELPVIQDQPGRSTSPRCRQTVKVEGNRARSRRCRAPVSSTPGYRPTIAGLPISPTKLASMNVCFPLSQHRHYRRDSSPVKPRHQLGSGGEEIALQLQFDKLIESSVLSSWGFR